MLEMYRTELETNVTEKTAKYEKGNWINMISSSYSLSSSSSCSCSDVCSFFFASLIFSLCFMKKHPTANPMITAKMIIISTEGVNPSISFSFSFYLLEIKTIQT